MTRTRAKRNTRRNRASFTANYYNIDVDGETNPDAAWYYQDPKDAANEIRGRIAFWKGVQVIE